MYLCCLARLRGVPVTVLPESSYDHWVGRSFKGGKVVGNALQTSYRRRALSERNKSYTFFVCWPTALVYPCFAFHLVILSLEGLLLSALKADRNIFRSIYLPCVTSVWKEKNCLMQERNRVQRSSRIGLVRFLRVFTPVPYKMKMLMRFGLPAIRS